MATLLSSERPATAAVTLNPFRMVSSWLTRARANRAQRMAFKSLMSMDPWRLDDLGINRGDLFDAMHAGSHAGTRVLSERRAHRSSEWLHP